MKLTRASKIEEKNIENKETCNMIKYPLKRSKFFNVQELKEEEEKPIKENFLVLPTKEDNFIKDFVHEINKARNDCKKYSKKFDELALNVRTNYSNLEKYLFYKNEIIRIKGGGLTLYNYSIYLENLHNLLQKERKFLEEIKFTNELSLPFPEELENWNDKELLKKSINFLQDKVKGKYNIKEFLYKKFEIIDGEISAILSIIDESEIIKTFLNEKIKFIGISLKKFTDNNLSIYIVLAK